MSSQSSRDSAAEPVSAQGGSVRERITQNIAAHGGSFVLPDPNIEIAGLQWLLDTLVFSKQVAFHGATLSSDDPVTVTGTLSLFNVAFDVSVSVSGDPLILGLRAKLADSQTPQLSDVVTHFFPTLSPPNIELSELRMNASTGETSFRVDVGLSGGTQALPVGARGLVISTVSGTLEYAKLTGQVSADLRLTARIGTTSVVLNYKPPADVSLTGIVPRIDLSAAIDAFVDKALGLPSGFPNVTLRNSSFSVHSPGKGQPGSYAAALATHVDDWGALELRVQHSGSWQLAAGFALVESFDLTRLGSALGRLPLDSAKLAPSTVVISSYTGDNPFQQAALKSAVVVEGVSFSATLQASSAKGGLSRALGFVSGSTAELDMQGVLTTPIDDSYVEADIKATTTIPNTKITLGDPALRLSLAPAVQVRGDVMIPLKGQFIELTGGLTVSTTEAQLFVDADFSQLKSPIGFAGVTLENIGGSMDVTFEPPGVGLTLEGDFLIGSAKADSQFALAFSYTPPVEVNPRLLRAHFAELDISTMITALAPQVRLPAELDDVRFRNFTIYWADSQVSLPDGTTTNPGYGLSALVDVFGWTAYGSLDINATKGFTGRAALSPIDLGHGAFRFTGNGKGFLGVHDGGPTFDIDTTKSSFAFSAAAHLLGITGATSGSFSHSGGQFSVTANTGGGYDYLRGMAQGRFGRDLHHPDISFSADIGMRLDFKTSRIMFPGTRYAVGRLHVQADASGSMHTSLQGTKFSLDAGVGFGFFGKNWRYTLPSIHAQPKELANFGKTIEASIADNAADLFGSLWSNAAGYLNLIEKGVLTEIDADPLGILTNVFHLSEGDALKLLSKLKGLIPHVDTRFPPHADTKGPHVDTPHADTKPHVDTRGPHIDSHADIKWVIHKHVDSAPHVDTRGPHIDTHGDTAPHVDTPSKHVDI